MGLFKRREKSIDVQTMLMLISQRVSAATQEDQLDTEEEREMWRTIQRGLRGTEPTVDALLAKMEPLEDHDPAEVRSGLLRDHPGEFVLANRAEYEVWKKVLAAMDDAEFERAARSIEDRPSPTTYHCAKVVFLDDGRRGRGLPPGVVREPQAAADLQVRENLGVTDWLDRAESNALRIDCVMNAMEDMLQRWRAEAA